MVMQISLRLGADVPEALPCERPDMPSGSSSGLVCPGPCWLYCSCTCAAGLSHPWRSHPVPLLMLGVWLLVAAASPWRWCVYSGPCCHTHVQPMSMLDAASSFSPIHSTSSLTCTSGFPVGHISMCGLISCMSTCSLSLTSSPALHSNCLPTVTP